MKPKRQSRKSAALPFNPIRVERELLRFPIHHLAKRGMLNIDIRGKDKTGKEFRWRVSPSRNYGEPRELAYKLDTLLINRRIEEAGRSKPKVIRLGSLRAICRELGLSEGCSSDIKEALRQNAHTGITAKVSYQGQDGIERTIEGDFNRYSVIFTGERFSDGRRADAVYIILNDVYREVLNNAGTRPLDYDYLKVLPPTAQRFYELVSPQVFAAIKHKLPFAKYTYSNFCIYSALTRYTIAKQVKKQMYKVMQPHKRSGYLEAVAFEETVDSDGTPDWWIHLTPGEKAHSEFRQFSQRTNHSLETHEPFLLSGSELEAGTPSAVVEQFQYNFLWDLITEAIELPLEPDP
jgi:hypothetical protein